MNKVALGIDIAKKTFDASLRINDKYRDKSFSNNPEGYGKLLKWLTKYNVKEVHACLEATGSYSEDLAIYLIDHGHKVSIVNPMRIKAYGESRLIRNKTDKIDAHLIAEFCQKQEPEAWIAPSPEIRELQALVRHLDDLQQMGQQEVNRLGSGVKNEAVRISLQSHIAFLDQQIEQTKRQIAKHIDKTPKLKSNKELLESIPGIGETTATKLLAELPDINNYTSARQVVAYAGLSPRHHQSGTSVKRKPKLSKIGSPQLRKALFFPAMVAKKHNPIIKEFSQRLRERGKNKMLIVGAAMRKLIHIVFGVLRSQRPFDPNFLKSAA